MAGMISAHGLDGALVAFCQALVRADLLKDEIAKRGDAF
jgi:hypothetical protein